MKAVRPRTLAALLSAGLGLWSVPPAPAAAPRPAAHRAADRSALFESTDLAVSGRGAHTYRIPALATLPDGALLAAYDRRNDSAADLPGNVDVMVRRSTDQGRTWSAPRAAVDYDGGVGAGDPSLLVDRTTGRVFLFHAYAPKGVGFGSAGAGNAPDSTGVLHTDYSSSDDGGRSWRHRRLTRDLKDPSWRGIFASSGAGSQLAGGRLLQQYAFRKADGSMWAASAYSDDHGASWHLGTPVGPRMDENKTVELADGRVLLNSRTSSVSRRLVAYSRDGGLTYSAPAVDDELIDPANNASLLRYDPAAPARLPRAHWLLFSNTASTGARENLTVRVSCDDGETWPLARTVTRGAAAYSTLTRLTDGTFGLLYESGPYRTITFARFDGAWLGVGACPAGRGRARP
ncbi:exo-alpha-sialidase [Streptomyces lydicus]|uniref:sialidase family protein n=1 Tax=Streptomyces lydicus TaxID=47763 RepID=UPI003681B698